MLALAAKGGRIAVMSIDDMEQVVSQITIKGDIDPYFRKKLTDKSFFEVACHYGKLATEAENFDIKAGQLAYSLANGENPYPVPADAFILPDENDDPLSLLNFNASQEKLLVLPTWLTRIAYYKQYRLSPKLTE